MKNSPQIYLSTSDIQEAKDLIIDSNIIVSITDAIETRTVLYHAKKYQAKIVIAPINRSNIALDAEHFYGHIGTRHQLLLTTSNCESAADAIATALNGRDTVGVNWINLEIDNKEKNGILDCDAMYEAALYLVREGFIVVACSNDDLEFCYRMRSVGCVALNISISCSDGRSMGQHWDKLRLICGNLDLPIMFSPGSRFEPSYAPKVFSLGVSSLVLDIPLAFQRK
jgi:thiazole synthase ThiGH ThiG subunit